MRGLEERAWIRKREDSRERVDGGERASGSVGGIYTVDTSLLSH